MWRGAWLLLAAFLLATMIHADSDTPSVNEGGDAEGAEEGHPHHRTKRQMFDGFRFSKDGIMALEQLDEFMRTTIPNVDRFRCVERLMCSLAAGQLVPSEPQFPGGQFPGGQFPGFDPTFQQGQILNPSIIQQGFSGLVQNPAALQQGLQGLGQGLQGLVQGQGLQGLVQGQGLQGLVQGQGLQGLVQNLGFTQGSPSGFQNSIPLFRENRDAAARVSGTEDTSESPSAPPQAQSPVAPPHVWPPGAPQVLRRRRPPVRRRPQRRGFLDYIRRLGRRKKRSVLDDLVSGLSPARFIGMLDQTMSPYSFYPFTKAALRGFSGSPGVCETEYPECPSTVEQMLDLFNNIHKYYPDGIPYKDNLPWFLQYILP